MDVRSIINRFAHHPPLDDEVAQAHQETRGLYLSVALVLAGLPEGQERDLAIQKLHESCMHANAAIAIHSSPAGISDLHDDTIEMIHLRIVGHDQPLSREKMIADIQNYMTNPLLDLP
jgi:hypothetical protein